MILSIIIKCDTLPIIKYKKLTGIKNIMTKYDKLKEFLSSNQSTWLVTGCAGFIGSNLIETLLKLNQKVVGLDNFSTGYQDNLNEVETAVTAEQWLNFKFIEGDIRDTDTCNDACADVDYVLHQAALGSVPRSIDDPINTNNNNITGHLNMLTAARDAEVTRFVYAASSSTYGDHPGLPKVEDTIGKPLSPYAITKYVNELYAEIFASTYGFETIGLRYFNVFGPRQNPNGAYAAVIPKWIEAQINGDQVFINGDGETSRDFCFIDNTVQANLLAATATSPEATNEVYNVALGDRTSLTELYSEIQLRLTENIQGFEPKAVVYRDFRAGDVKHSQAETKKAQTLLGYAPTHKIANGLSETVKWYVAKS